MLQKCLKQVANEPLHLSIYLLLTKFWNLWAPVLAPPSPVMVKFCMQAQTDSVCLRAQFCLERFISSPFRNKKLTNYYYYYYYTHFIYTTLCPGLPRWVGTRRINHSGFCWSKRWWGGSGISWTICKLFALHSRRQPRQHVISQIFTVRMPFLTPNQQRQSAEGN